MFLGGPSVEEDVYKRQEEKRAWLDQMQDVALGSDAFFPFGDNIDRAYKSGVKYVAEPGGSVRDDNVIAACDQYGMALSLIHIWGQRSRNLRSRRCRN